MKCELSVLSIILLQKLSSAWLPRHTHSHERISEPTRLLSKQSHLLMSGNLHGQNSCFLPLKQLDQDYYAPRIIQIAGSYPGILKNEFFAALSEPAPPKGQWAYDFSVPDGLQLGTVAIEGSEIVHAMEDPIVIIAEHTSLGLPLPETIKDAVDLLVLVDRSKTNFVERKFLVVDDPRTGIAIGSYHLKSDMPSDSKILGQVELVQVPWLPAMSPSKTGFMESDEYF